MNAIAAIPAHIRPRVKVVPGFERRRAVLDAVRVGHHEADRDQQRRVDDELQVERAPRRPDGLGGPVGDARWFGSDDAHQSFE